MIQLIGDYKRQNKINTADRYAPADFFVRQGDTLWKMRNSISNLLERLAKE